MARVKDFNKNEAKVPENPCSLPITLTTEEVGLTIVILNQIVPADQIFITAKSGVSKLAGSTPTELTFRIRRGGVDGIEVYKRVRTISEIGSYCLTMLTHVESGITGQVQMYTLTVQMTKGALAEAQITNFVSMSGVVYGD